jgi:hypothetical protein
MVRVYQSWKHRAAVQVDNLRRACAHCGNFGHRTDGKNLAARRRQCFNSALPSIHRDDRTVVKDHICDISGARLRPNGDRRNRSSRSDGAFDKPTPAACALRIADLNLTRDERSCTCPAR